MMHIKSIPLLLLLPLSLFSAEEPKATDFTLKSERGPIPPIGLYSIFFLDDGAVVVGTYAPSTKKITPLMLRDNRRVKKVEKTQDEMNEEEKKAGLPVFKDEIHGAVKPIKNPQTIKGGGDVEEKNILSWRPYHIWPTLFDVSADLMGGVEYAFFTTTADEATDPEEKETDRASLPFVQINLHANPRRPEPNDYGFFTLMTGSARFSSNLVEGSDVAGQITKANAASIGGEIYLGGYADDATGFPYMYGLVAMGRYDYYDQETAQGEAQGTNAFGLRLSSKYDFNAYVQVDMGRAEPINSRLMSIRTQLPINLDFINPTNIYFTISAQLSYDEWNRTKEKDNLMFGVSYIIDVSELKKAAKGLIK